MGPLENGRNNPNLSELNNPAIEPVCRQYAELRYQLMPYTYTLAREARDTGMPLMRAMWLHYPDDPKAVADGSQYLWGRDILVAPVFKQGARSREVYLPKGDWYDWWTGERQTGGRSLTREVDLRTMPLYVRAGAIIPFDPVRQYTGEKPTEPTTLKLYRGADGRFTLYEDDGISLDYLNNRATWIRFIWNDRARRLTIEPGGPAGAASAPVSRSFKLQLLPEGTTKEVAYKGQRTEIVF
jgi:alpha-glucosidase/alpha-D-xyloside xylohydrolase